jgi:hypothetical protein
MFLGLLLAALPAAARELPPLSVHDVGEYGAVPWEVPEGPIEPGSRADRVRDLNFAVSSVNLMYEGDIPAEVLERWAKAAHLGAAQGKKFLPRVYFWDGKDRYTGPMRDTEVYWKRLDQFLGAMDLRDLHGMVLAEENVSYSGRPEVLTELYRRIKAKYDVAVWQWWSPSSAVPGSGGWIPADGWVIDNYFVPKDEFRRYLRKYVITGLPVVVMPWASADMEITPEQHQANSDQLDAAVEFNLPVAFYWTHKHSCYFGGDRQARETTIDRLNQWVWAYIERTKATPKRHTGQPSADRAEGTVREIGPIEGDEFIFRDDFSTSRCVDDCWMSGFRDLVLDDQKLSARGFLGRKVNVELIYRFAGEFPVKHPQVQLDAQLDPALHGKVEIALSTDARSWLTATAAGKSGALGLTSAADKRFAACQRLHLWIRLSGDPGSSARPPCRIDNLRLSSAVTKPTVAQALLRPSDNGAWLVYEDTFETRKYLYATTRTGDDKLEWSEGQVAVRLQPGGTDATLVWKVVADRPVSDIKIEVTGRANNGSLGTNHYLDVSLDGQDWAGGVSTVGMKTNVSGWTTDPLVIDLSGQPRYAGVREFTVRLRLTAGGYKERHRSLSGIVSRLRLTARAPGG